ncbi:MAG: hypothetical protein K8R58_00245, partial [Bacteroidales bacterium]|nr:hypothetical protein [Bacteroidales bacterium]
MNDDANNDIICLTDENEIGYYMKVYNINGENIFTTPLIERLSNCWLGDINKDSKIEIITSNSNKVYVIEIPIAGSSIGWPGQQGNLRNSGVLKHPAYFPCDGDTVYWMNTISLAGNNELPEGSTVIIKPGTKIKAHAGSSLIVHGILIAEGTEKYPITFTADINGAVAGYWQGITVPNHSSVSMKYCNIKDAEIGVLFEDYNEVTFSNCCLENNLVGIGAFNCSPVIRENIITGNDKGIGCYNNSSPVLTDLIYEEHFKNGIVNNTTGIYINNSSVSLNNGYNDIYNDPATGYFIKLEEDSTGRPTIINAAHNYWGTTIIDSINNHLDPSKNFNIEPVCSSSQSGYKSGNSIIFDLLKTAYTYFENKEYQNAETTFKSLIENYP